MGEGNITFRTFEVALLQAGLMAGLAVLGTGCQRMYWYQEGRTFDECKADHKDCWTELFKRTDRRYASSYKHKFVENCMHERGYELIAEKDLPLDVKREDPAVPSEVPWVHAYGVAGALGRAPPSVGPGRVPAEAATLTHR